MKMRRYLAGILSMVVLLAAGCQKGSMEETLPQDTGATKSQEADASSSDEIITLTVWRCNMTDERIELIEELHQAYMDENPNIRIEFTALPDSFNEKLLIAYSSGTGPDIIAHHNDVPTYIANEYIIPLDSYFNAYTGKDDYVGSILNIVRNMDQEAGQLYYLPEGINANCLWARSDWYAEAGLDLPETWEDLFASVETLTDKDAGRYGIAHRGGSGSASHLEMVMYSYSGIDKYFLEDGTCTVNDPKNVEFVERWLGLYGDYTALGDIGNGWTELAAAFQSGAAGLIQHNLGSASGHMTAFDGDLDKFQAIPFPLCEEGYSMNKAPTPTGICISSTCDYPQEAFDFAVYMTTAEATSRIGEMWGQIPCDATTLQDDWIRDVPWMSMAADLLLNENTRFYENASYLTSYNSILTNEVEPMVQAVMAGEMTAQEMCDRWADLMEEAYREMFE